MRSIRYLNTMLTIIAVLLSLNLWTQWTLGPSTVSGTANAAPLDRKETPGAGIPDAGGQRKEMIDLLKKMTTQVDTLTAMFKTGEAKVKVETSGDKAEKSGK